MINGEQKELKRGDLVFVYSRKREKIHCVFSHVNGNGEPYMHRVDNGKDIRRKKLSDVFFVSESNKDESESTERVEAIQKLNEKNKEIEDRTRRAEEKKASFSITQRFQILESFVRLVALGKRKGLIITGEGGLGKTHTVMEVLHDLNFKQEIIASDEPQEEQIEEGGAASDKETLLDRNVSDLKKLGVTIELSSGDKVITKTELKENNNGTIVAEGEEGDFIVIGGFATAKGMYNTVYEHRNKLIIFDDCDDVLTDKTARNILKMLLDTKPRRFVSWMSQSKNSGAPKQYEFFGEIIFISNLPKSKMSQAFRTRCSKVDVGMTPDEKIERMTTIKNSPKYMKDVSIEIKNEALELISKNRYAENISMRTLEEVIVYRINEPETWRMLSEYSMYS